MSSRGGFKFDESVFEMEQTARDTLLQICIVTDHDL